MPVIGKNMISWFFAYVEHIEIKTKRVNIINQVVLNYETKSKRNERNETKYYETQQNILKCETKRNETKYTKRRNETKIY
jgi:hypothetical protein